MPVTTPIAPGIREDPRLDLSLETLRRSTIRLTAWGASMLPSIWPGDMLTIEPVKHDEVVRGDIVLVLRNHRVFIHRVVETTEKTNSRMWITRGDSMPQSDPPATESNLLGRVVGGSRAGRNFAPNRKVSMLGSVLAGIFCRFDRIRNLALRIHAGRLHIASSQTGSAARVDLAEDANGVICVPYISQSSTSQG